MTKIEIELSDQDVELLTVLGQSEAVNGTKKMPAPTVDVLRFLVACATDGVRRPGSWERQWLYQSFGDGWSR